MCGSSYQPITRSGPVLRFAAIAAFGLTSSQVMYSTFTWTPVASWNFFVFWFHASSSALMNPLQRRRRNCASFSTWNIGLYLSWANERVAAAAAVPSPHCKSVRRRRVMRFPPGGRDCGARIAKLSKSASNSAGARRGGAPGSSGPALLRLVADRDRDPRRPAQARLRLELAGTRRQRGGIEHAGHAFHVEEPVAGGIARGGADDGAGGRAVEVGQGDGLVRLVVAARHDPAVLVGAEQGRRRDHRVLADDADDDGRGVGEVTGPVQRAVGERVVPRRWRRERHDSTRAAGDGGPPSGNQSDRVDEIGAAVRVDVVVEDVGQHGGDSGPGSEGAVVDGGGGVVHGGDGGGDAGGGWGPRPPRHPGGG